MEKFLVWGEKGWIAGHLSELLRGKGFSVATTAVRAEDRNSVLVELRRVKPTHVLNCAGSTGRPNVDWCEENRETVIRNNVIGALNLADCCFLEGIHITVFNTGCLYNYDTEHVIGGKPFTEEDLPNFSGSFYSHTKGMTESMLKVYPNCLILRLRMPISDDLHPRSFVTKIASYSRVINVRNSVTVLHDLLPASVILARKKAVGVYNFTNPGSVSHDEVLTLFKKYLNPELAWKTVTIDELGNLTKAGRSNCVLDSGKLIDELGNEIYEIPSALKACELCFQRIATKKLVN